MADIRDWGAFIRSRWDWTRFGYEHGFPRGARFSDNDAWLSLDGGATRVKIECKLYDGAGIIPKPDGGQLRTLREDAAIAGCTVLVLYGCGICDNPFALHQVMPRPPDRFEDWRGLDLAERRKRLKTEIDRAAGLYPGPHA